MDTPRVAALPRTVERGIDEVEGPRVGWSGAELIHRNLRHLEPERRARQRAVAHVLACAECLTPVVAAPHLGTRTLGRKPEPSSQRLRTSFPSNVLRQFA